MSCRSARRLIPVARASLARGLSSEVKSSVSPGSLPLLSKPSSVTRNGLANLRAILIIRFISFLFTRSPRLSCVGLALGRFLAQRGGFEPDEGVEHVGDCPAQEAAGHHREDPIHRAVPGCAPSRWIRTMLMAARVERAATFRPRRSHA